MTEKNQQIRERAFQLWEQQGRPDGKDMDHWIEAEQQLRDSANDESAAKPEGSKASTTGRAGVGKNDTASET